MLQNKIWNQNTIKNGNKTLVLETIMNHSPISRASIADKTGLNKGTVSSQVSELLDEDLIYEQGPGKSSGGRKPVILLFNEVAGYSIGIDIGVNYIFGILTDLKGNICQEKSLTFNKLSFDEIKEKLFEIVDCLITSAPSSTYGIVGIGIGVPGATNKNGKVLLAPNLGWQNIDLKTIVENRYDCPVIIENEANAGAYGEKKFGTGVDDIIYVSIGVGIGVGLILNGDLYQGNDGFSGEMGHMTIQADGKTCRCGNDGCWELYASEQALINKADQFGLEMADENDILQEMVGMAEDGDQEAINLFKTIGDYMGVGLINIINSFNPQQVIIGNRITAAKKWVEQPLLEKVNKNALWFQQNHLEINFSELSGYTTALGVAAFSTENFFKIYKER
ncbi:ROK family transcriptional regulator [Lentibacillus salicampi]|uniref:ROK family transcriptional regulator n=1 Tax=Lentibacillus salicampi TaxID=175306 RepID=A0A4Y9ADR8_9BACI|nr:ROK family transcriptional regulator [Lentibacillus salicampi]TFJ93090.1 ROK family transcriptional regulator [Lentibacillus salicampi]